MTPERWQKINDVFQSVVELGSAERNAFLDEACLNDDSLRQQVETLLAANEEAGAFIDGNAAKDLAHLLTLKNSPTEPGESLGHYEIISILGSGGMGKVYLAKDSKLNRPVAVKTLPDSFSSKSDYVRRFQTEAKAAANLNHPNVATIFSVEETDENQFFITMEYVEGKPLNEMIPAHGLDLRTFLEWFIALADALSHAHQKGIVHRDIKPGNIMITPLGIPKILDFGLAIIDRKKIAHDDLTLKLTRTGQVLGTPTYMSPEQAEGKKADQRSDIFSFGVVMYESLTGAKPFNGENYASIVSELLTKEPRNLAEIKPDIPYLLSRLVMKCLNKDLRYRYQSMDEVRLILKEINSAIESGVSLSRQTNRSFLSKPGSFMGGLALGAICFLLLLISGYGFWKWKQSSDTAQPVTRFSIHTPKGQDFSLFEARISPDGQNIIFPSRQSGVFPLFIRPLDKFEAKPIEGTENAKLPFFSPDGKWIGFTTGTRGLKKIPVTGGVSLLICETCVIDFDSFWAEDNTIIFADNTGLFRISADGGEPERLTTVNEEANERAHRSPQVLPDGKTLLFTIDTGKHSKLAVMSLATKEIQYLDDVGEAWLGKYISTGHLIFARETQLMAMPFDLKNLKISGKPIPVLPDVFSFLPNFQIAQNGTLVYLPTTSTKENSLVWVNRKGEVTPVLDKKGDYSSPRISPDGQHIAVMQDDDIWVYETESGRSLRLTFEGKNQIPLWSLDSKSVIYTTEKDGVFTVYRKNADGTGDAEKLLTSENRHSAYSLNSKENTLALTAFVGQGNTDIVTQSLDDKKTTTFVGTGFIEDTPRFSPDGNWLVYFTMETGNSEVYVLPWGKSGNKIPITKDGGLFPVWSPNGKEIIYRRGAKFYSTEVQTTPEFKVGATQILFEGKYLTSYDISPDGQRFLLVKNDQGVMPTQLNVVLNWMDELKTIIKVAK